MEYREISVFMNHQRKSHLTIEKGASALVVIMIMEDAFTGVLLRRYSLLER